MSGPKVRLHLDQPLAQGQALALVEGQANYLFAVMRLGAGDEILVFNNQDGEWIARIAEANKKRGTAICERQTRETQLPPDLWLLFTPIKKERTTFIIEKAVELGVARVQPVSTRRMTAERLRIEKHRAHAVEAAEQCGATFVPEISPLQPLEKLLSAWDPSRRLYWADEIRAGAARDWAGERGAPAAILIGPEGGFTEEERAALAAHDFVTPVALGPRILRAETAALAAVTLWQSRFGDWA